jgi:HAD superfamily hydrolase (TIGR01549 family)
MKYLLCLFDLDGTLIDSHEAICKAVNDTLAEYGVEKKSVEELRKQIGYPLSEMLSSAGLKLDSGVMDVYRHYYFQYIELHQKIYAGIQETMKELCGKVSMSIVTNKGKQGSELSLKPFGLGKYFDFIVTERDVTNLKPHKEPFQKILELYRLENKIFKKPEILMIGDSPVDIDFAKNCGIDSAFASWGFFDYSDLKSKPLYVLTKPQELIDIVASPGQELK